MDTHTTGRAKDAWRARNAGADAPGDGQNVDQPAGAPDLSRRETGLSTENAPGLVKRGRPHKT